MGTTRDDGRPSCCLQFYRILIKHSILIIFFSIRGLLCATIGIGFQSTATISKIVAEASMIWPRHGHVVANPIFLSTKLDRIPRSALAVFPGQDQERQPFFLKFRRYETQDGFSMNYRNRPNFTDYWLSELMDICLY